MQHPQGALAKRNAPQEIKTGHWRCVTAMA